mmetsp:Transcript_87299/g.245040  ORF Transcript_87299/g.245040 Transcript_87299/m.245040 type:complete len:221 (+) Transcript_87299:925-1587(+)
MRTACVQIPRPRPQPQGAYPVGLATAAAVPESLAGASADSGQRPQMKPSAVAEQQERHQRRRLSHDVRRPGRGPRYRMPHARRLGVGASGGFPAPRGARRWCLENLPRRWAPHARPESCLLSPTSGGWPPPRQRGQPTGAPGIPLHAHACCWQCRSRRHRYRRKSNEPETRREEKRCGRATREALQLREATQSTAQVVRVAHARRPAGSTGLWQRAAKPP